MTTRRPSGLIKRARSSRLNAAVEWLAALSTVRTNPIGRALRFLIRRIPPTLRVPVLRGTLRGKRWITGASNHSAWLGTYEHSKRARFECSVTPGAVVFDVGAHVGYYTLLASMLVGPAGRVVAFEPSPRNLAYLRAHLEINHVTNATVIARAVSDRPGTIMFEEGDAGSLGYTGRLSPEGTRAVHTVSLDDLVAGGQVTPPDVIKIDVEGAERAVLSGATALLRERHPTIFLATHGADVHRACCDMLRSLGYHLVAIDGDDIETTREVLATYGAGAGR